MSSGPTNLLLDSLSPHSRDILVSRTTFVNLPIRSSLYKAEEPPEYAYFMTSGIASIVAAMDDGKTAEVGVIGREGVVGTFHLLGSALFSTDCFIQLTATALRIRMVDLKTAFRSSEEVRDRLLEFVQEQSLVVSQFAACNRLHMQEERLARWLLMVQDRIQSDVLEITQEFLAQMLGAKRTTVTVVAGEFQRDGIIEYTRGRIRILDRERLERAACCCYRISKAYRENLYSETYLAHSLPRDLESRFYLSKNRDGA